MFPTLFISHGAPNIILGNSYSKNNIRKFALTLQKPKYIIIFSAHYQTNDLKIINFNTKDLMYDFYGFEDDLYKFKYKISSDKDISLKIIEELKKHTINIEIDKQRTSYDHGVWTTLSMMYKNLDIPIIQLSIPKKYTAEELINLGEILKEFKDDAMIICTGGITHNLSKASRYNAVDKDAYIFNQKIVEIINNADDKELLSILKKELFLKNHPSNEHFMSLYIAFGNAFNKKGKSFNHEMQLSSISMESFIFD